MDFFEWQDRSRFRTGVWVGLFALAVAAIVVALHFATAGVLALATEGDFARYAGDPFILGAVALAAGAVIALGTAECLAELETGGFAVAEMVGGRRVALAGATDAEVRLMNVVEEMAIAAGLPVPVVCVLDRERGINAFAAGWSPDQAVVCVTRGALVQLPREEMQAVVAHEFSHILHGDMRLNTMLLGFLHGILSFGLMGRALLVGDTEDDEGFVPIAHGRFAFLTLVAGVLLTAIGYIGVVVGRLIKSAVSREREYLADAAAVQFTRNPVALARALRRIGGFVHGSRLRHARAEAVSHFLFGRYDADDDILGWFATHPPLVARIRRLAPAFDGTFPPVPLEPGLYDFERPESPLALSPVGLRPSYTSTEPLDPVKFVAGIGAPVREHLDRAARLLDALPRGLREALHDPGRVGAILYALLLSREPGLRSRQLALVARRADAAVRDEVEAAYALVAAQPRAARLAMVHQTLPSILSLPETRLQVLADTVEVLATADQSIDLFEYALGHILARAIRSRHEGRARPVQVYGVLGAAREISVLLSALAWAGGGGGEAARASFDSAATRFGREAGRLSFVPAASAGLDDADRALRAAAGFSPDLKRTVVAASLFAVARDGRIDADEAELLRAVSAAMDVPVPLWVEAA
ncbi:MAG: M48 family metallopeptidase [Verrucomicrobia bacterium]|nr:M48 family metallopeptidase [Verrucomicrobiota bacterium]